MTQRHIFAVHTALWMLIWSEWLMQIHLLEYFTVCGHNNLHIWLQRIVVNRNTMWQMCFDMGWITTLENHVNNSVYSLKVHCFQCCWCRSWFLVCGWDILLLRLKSLQNVYTGRWFYCVSGRMYVYFSKTWDVLYPHCFSIKW